MMSTNKKILATTLAALVLMASLACSFALADGNEGGTEGTGGSGEEGASAIAPDQAFNGARKGTRLIIGYVPESRAFVGMVGNVSDQTLQQVRVEVHLFNTDNELGPTTPMDLAPGQWIPVWLPDEGTRFTEWVPHAEVGPQSGGGEGGSEGGGEHGGSGGEGGGEGGGEHGSGGESGSG